MTYLSPQLLSVLVQNDITESNHEIYMGGAGWTGAGRAAASPASHGGSLRAGLSAISSPLRARAPEPAIGDVSFT